MINKIWFISIFSIICTILSTTTESAMINKNGEIKFNNMDSTSTGSTSGGDESYSLDDAYKLLMYSYSAYCEPNALLNWTCPYCKYNNIDTSLIVTELITHDKTDTFGYMGYTADKRSIVLSFRGTNMESLDNWITNLNFAKTEPYPAFPGALVHAGFNHAYRSVRDIVHQAFNETTKQCPTCDNFIITGHSLGGALSILSALDIYETSLTNLPLKLYTYGSPRVGDVAFAEYFESTILNVDERILKRIVNDHDLVPHLPAMAWNFYHLTTEVWTYNATNPSLYKACSSTNGEDPTCSDSLKIALNVAQHLAYYNINKDLC